MAHKCLEVLPPGSRVTLDGGSVEGVILESCIGPGLAVSYQVAWWDAGKRESQRVEACEVEPAGRGERLRIGFGDTTGD